MESRSTTRTSPRNYSVADLSGKRDCKRALLAEYGLRQDNLDRPLFGIISRFAAQKGFDIFADAAAHLLEEDLNLVVLGSGDTVYESMFRDLAQAYPAKWACRSATIPRLPTGSKPAPTCS